MPLWRGRSRPVRPRTRSEPWRGARSSPPPGLSDAPAGACRRRAAAESARSAGRAPAGMCGDGAEVACLAGVAGTSGGVVMAAPGRRDPPVSGGVGSGVPQAERGALRADAARPPAPRSLPGPAAGGHRDVPAGAPAGGCGDVPAGVGAHRDVPAGAPAGGCGDVRAGAGAHRDVPAAAPAGGCGLGRLPRSTGASSSSAKALAYAHARRRAAVAAEEGGANMCSDRREGCGRNVCACRGPPDLQGKRRPGAARNLAGRAPAVLRPCRVRPRGRPRGR